MKRLILILAIVLGLLHQDFWWWDEPALVLGFMPIGMFYHVLFSIAVALLWVAAVKFAWPADLERWADEPHDRGSRG